MLSARISGARLCRGPRLDGPRDRSANDHRSPAPVGFSRVANVGGTGRDMDAVAPVPQNLGDLRGTGRIGGMDVDDADIERVILEGGAEWVNQLSTKLARGGDWAHARSRSTGTGPKRGGAGAPHLSECPQLPRGASLRRGIISVAR
jgi:hypothetical protein